MALPDVLQVSSTWIALLDAAGKAVVLLAGAALGALMLRRASAASRHMVWTGALVAALALPVLSLALPRWEIPLVRFEAEPNTGGPTAQSPPPGAESPEPGAVLSREPEAESREPLPAESREPGAERLLQPEAKNQEPRDLSAMLLAVWIAGALLVLGRLAIGLVAVHVMARRTTAGDGASWLPVARELAGELGVKRVDFRRSERSAMPMTWGVWRPVVVLPASADAWPSERVRIALLHELAHVKRADCLTHMLAQAACAVHWINPLAWIAAKRARAERERACDDLVLACGTPGADYADELLQIARAAQSDPFTATAAGASLAMARRSQLEGRLMAILDPTVPRTGVSRLRAAAVTAAATLALVPLASLQPWGYAEAAVVPPLTIAGETEARPALRSVVLPAPAPTTPTAEAQAAAAPQTAAEEIVAGVAEGVAAAIPAVLEGILGQNPNPNPNPNPNTNSSESRAQADPKVVAALTTALKDSDKEVRESAMHALVRLRAPGVFEPLVQGLSDESADVRESAAFGLGQLRDKRAVAPLTAALRDSAASVREQAAFGLGQLGDAQAIDGLAGALRDEAANVREQAAFALGQIRDARAVAPLLAALKDTAHEVREQVVFALGQLRASAAVDGLIASLADENSDVREQAAFALGQVRDPKAIDALTQALKDASVEVRRQAAFALGHLSR